MAKTIFDKQHSNLDGSIEQVDRELSGRDANRLWQFYNDLNENVDLTIYGTRAGDDNFSEAVKLVDAKTISSGGTPHHETLTNDPWEQIRIELDPAADPTSGSLKVYEMSNR